MGFIYLGCNVGYCAGYLVLPAALSFFKYLKSGSQQENMKVMELSVMFVMFRNTLKLLPLSWSGGVGEA